MIPKNFCIVVFVFCFESLFGLEVLWQVVFMVLSKALHHLKTMSHASFGLRIKSFFKISPHIHAAIVFLLYVFHIVSCVWLLLAFMCLLPRVVLNIF